MNPPLSHIVSWSHQLISEALSEGACAVDLTAGNGYDTLMLARCVGSSGKVLAFDLQAQAIANTAGRLLEVGVQVHHSSTPGASLGVGVNLVHGSHADLGLWCTSNPLAIIANLGYLPGGDKEIVTRPDTTLMALNAGAEVLALGGRMAVVVYHTHPGGREDADAVESFFAGLDESSFNVLRMEVQNRSKAPFLLVAEKHA